MNEQHSFIEWFNRRTPSQILVLFYFIALLISTVILSMPIAYNEGVSVAFIDILFTAVSALSVTGLSTISIPETFSTIGMIFLSIILHLGLFGVMSISTLILLLFGRKISITDRRLLMQDQNMINFGGMVYFIKQMIAIVLTIELFSIILLGTYFLRYFSSPQEAYFHGYFYTISALSNAGFSLYENSVAMFANDYIVQTILMILIVFGAIGYPVLVEVKTYFFTPKSERRLFRFSLFTKVTSITFFLLVIFGTLFVYIFDFNNFFKQKHWLESTFYALFQSVTTRSAGLSTMDVVQFSEANQLFVSFLMFIGASPSSSGGGIRTTTFALVIIFIITFARGGKKVKIFNREIYDEDLLKAVTVTLLAILMVFISLMLLTLIEGISITALIFEVTSAFGTVGLSQGITSDLSTFSKIILMFLMFIGRLGIVTFMFIFKHEGKQAAVRYPKERMIIG